MDERDQVGRPAGRAHAARLTTRARPRCTELRDRVYTRVQEAKRTHG